MIELPRNKREEGNMLTDATTEQLAQREALEDLRQEVGRLQQEVMRRKAPVAIVLEGWGARSVQAHCPKTYRQPVEAG